MISTSSSRKGEDLKSIKCKTTAVSKEIHGNTAEAVGFFTNPLTAAMTRTRSARITAMRVSRELWSSRSFRSVSKTSSYSKALELVRCILYRTAKCKTKRLMEIDMITPILKVKLMNDEHPKKGRRSMQMSKKNPLQRGKDSKDWKNLTKQSPSFSNILDKLSNKNHCTEALLAANTNCRLKRLERGTSNAALAQLRPPLDMPP